MFDSLAASGHLCFRLSCLRLSPENTVTAASVARLGFGLARDVCATMPHSARLSAFLRHPMESGDTAWHLNTRLMTFLRAEYNRGGNLGEQFVSHEQIALRHVAGTYYWREEFNKPLFSDAPLMQVFFFLSAYFIQVFLGTEISDDPWRIWQKKNLLTFNSKIIIKNEDKTLK